MREVVNFASAYGKVLGFDATDIACIGTGEYREIEKHQCVQCRMRWRMHALR